MNITNRSIWETRSIFLLEIVTHTVCVNILYITIKLTITSHIVINLHIISGKILKYHFKSNITNRSIWETRSIFLLEIVTHTVCVNILYIITMLTITTVCVNILYIITMLASSLYIVINLHIISGKIFKYHFKSNIISRSIWEIRLIFLLGIVTHTVCVNILFTFIKLAVTSHIVIIFYNNRMSNF